MTRSLNRQLTKLKMRKQKRLNFYLETMGAKYTDLTTKDPRKVALCHEPVEIKNETFVSKKVLEALELMHEQADKEKLKSSELYSMVNDLDDLVNELQEKFSRKYDKFWYEHHEERVSLVNAHPDIKKMVELVYLLNNAFKANDSESLKEGFAAVDLVLDNMKGVPSESQ